MRTPRSSDFNTRTDLFTDVFVSNLTTKVSPIAPSFRVLALAEPPSLQQPWLTEELSASFATHRPESSAQWGGRDNCGARNTESNDSIEVCRVWYKSCGHVCWKHHRGFVDKHGSDGVP